MTSIGIYRHLSHCSSPQSTFCVIAVDHRANLRASLDQAQGAPITDDAFRAFKRDVAQALLPHSTAILTDPDFGIGAGIAEGIISGDKGILAPLEVTDYDLHPSLRDTEFIPNWSVEQIKAIGGDGVKLLLYFNPYDQPKAQAKIALVEQIQATCRLAQLPLFLEPIPYSVDPTRDLADADYTTMVIESARLFATMGVDILKVPFPVNEKLNSNETAWQVALEALNRACGQVPWALLSAGASFEVFLRQAEMACQNGASGVIVGRAVWAEAVKLPSQERITFLQTIGVQRMQQLASVCADATSWRSKLNVPSFLTGWYTQ
ncbi:MAG: tagatose 1,6-diphosphate aldolase [Phototrophicaceae bacterium]